MGAMTEEQRAAWLAEVTRAEQDGDDPDPEAWGGPQPLPGPFKVVEGNGRRQEPAAPAFTLDPGRFTFRDLSPAGVGNHETYTMPGGKTLLVFPLSSDEAADLARWSATVAPQAEPGDSPERLRMAAVAVGYEIMAMQVILCCYVDEARQQRAFEPKHLRDIMRSLPAEVVSEIVELSKSLARRPTKESLAPFFSRAESCMRSWSAACADSECCPPGLRDETTDLLSRWPEWS